MSKQNKINKELIDKIIEMGIEDQEIRKRYMDTLGEDPKSTKELIEEMRIIDSKNTETLREILKKIGFPTISRVGRKCAKYAWLIVQHSPDDEFMQDYLEQMEEYVFKEVEKGWYRRLVDRVLIRKGRKQVYGTQHKLPS